MAENDEVLHPVMLAATAHGHRLFRNNSGVARYYDKQGNEQVVRYGVGKGGSDGLGWTRLVVTEEMVGQAVAVFTAVEAKTGRKKPTSDQETFLKVVREAGGIAVWGNDPDRIVEDWTTEVHRIKNGE